MIRAESFDVFDTVLVRDVLAPSDVFPRIGERLVSATLRADVSADDFGRLRASAETVARQASPHEDITLEEIWRQLVVMLGWAWSPDLMDAELAEEAEALAPVEAARPLLDAARARHGRAIFITDSYYPRTFLEGQLRRFDLMKTGDALYISSEARRTKSSGSLFRSVLDSERLAPRELRHHGDNPGSDVRVPRKLGIAATRHKVPDLTRNEHALLAAPLASIRALRDIAGASRQFRQAGDGGNRDPGTVETAGSFLGPFCGMFAAWALSAAQRHGIERLYFCARDCQTAWKAARILADEYGGIDCRYLYVSRQALFLPSARSADRRELHWLRRPFERPLVDRILAKLDLDHEHWRAALRGIGHEEHDGAVLRDDSDWQRFWALVEEGPLHDAIERKARERRASALAYFRAEGLLDGARAGLVDLGWHLTCQASLRKILQEAERGPGTELRGFYLQLNGDRLAPAEAGAADYLFMEPASDLDRFGTDLALHHMDAFLEHVVGQASHASTIGYAMAADGRAEPIFSQPGPSADEAARVAQHQAATAAYVARYRKRIVAWAARADLLPLVMHRVSSAFFRNAGGAAVSSLRHIAVSIDQTGRDVRSLMGPISWWEAIRPVFPARVLKRSQGDPYQPWPHAKAIVSSRFKNAAYRTARLAGRARSWLWQRLLHGL